MRWFSQVPDRRRSPRFKADFWARATLAGDSEIISLPVHCYNISEEGLRTSDIEGLALGDLISLELHIPISTQIVWVDSLVRHGGGGCGLQFVSLSENRRTLIREYCNLQPKEKRLTQRISV